MITQLLDTNKLVFTLRELIMLTGFKRKVIKEYMTQGILKYIPYGTGAKNPHYRFLRTEIISFLIRIQKNK